MTEFDDPQLVGMARLLTPETSASSAATAEGSHNSSKCPTLPVNRGLSSTSASSQKPTTTRSEDERAGIRGRISSLRDPPHNQNNKSSNGKKTHSVMTIIIGFGREEIAFMGIIPPLPSASYSYYSNLNFGTL